MMICRALRGCNAQAMEEMHRRAMEELLENHSKAMEEAATRHQRDMEAMLRAQQQTQGQVDSPAMLEGQVELEQIRSCGAQETAQERPQVSWHPTARYLMCPPYLRYGPCGAHHT